MPQLQPIILSDRTPTTPVQHTFVPRDIVDRVGTVVSGDGTLVGEKKLTVSTRRTEDRFRTRIVLAIPKTQDVTVGGVTRTTVINSGFANIEFVIPADWTEQERKNLVGMSQSSLDPSKVLVNDAVIKQEGIY